MLKKTKRLTTKEFQEVFQKGKRVSSPLFLLSFLKKDKGKVAVSIPKKIYNKAVDRNNVKRVIFECLKKQDMPTSTGVVIVIRKKLDNIPMSDVCKDLYDSLKKISI